MKNRIISIALAFAMLLGFSSCKKAEKEEIPPKNQNLTVEIETVAYDDASVEEASARIADITARVLLRYYNKQLTDAEVAQADAAVRTEIIPILCEIPIGRDELFSMIACAEESLEEGEKSETDHLGSYLDLYKSFGKVLDGLRLGALLYELELLNLDRKADEAMKKYNNSNGKHHLEEAEYYLSLIDKAERLGRAKFADAFSVFAFMASSVAGGVDTDMGSVSVTIGDVFVILGKQGEKFASMELGDADWQTVAEICEDFIPTRASSLRDRILISLGYDDFFIEAAVLLPDVIALYATLTKDISKENIAILESSDPLAYERVMCSELLKNREALADFLSVMEKELPTVGAKSLAAITAYDRDGYHEFLERDVANADGLIAALEAFAVEPTEQGFVTVKETFVSFLAGINPVVAYVYFYN